MGTDIIQAKYEELAQIAQRFKQQAEESEELRSQLQRAFEALTQDGWEGAGVEAFTAEMEGEIFPALLRLIAALEEAQAVTLEISKLVQQAEEEAAARFGGQADGGTGGFAGATASGTVSSGGGGGDGDDDDGWTFMGVLHEGLDWAGFIPGLGAVPDLINAGLYAIEGDWGNAALSGAAAVPIVGDIAKGVDKARDIAKAVDKVGDAARAVDKADDVVDAARAVDKASDLNRLTKPDWTPSDDIERKIFDNWDNPKLRKIYEDRFTKRFDIHNQNIDAAIKKGNLQQVIDNPKYSGVDFDNPRVRELSYDPSSTKFKPDEGLSGLRAEERGVLPGPVRRSINSEGKETGFDLMDAQHRHWDVKNASDGAVDIADKVRNGERILVDDRALTTQQRQDLIREVNEHLGGNIDLDMLRFVEGTPVR